MPSSQPDPPQDLATGCATAKEKQRRILRKICKILRMRCGARDDESDEKAQ